jgi:RecA/RadA recombinase
MPLQRRGNQSSDVSSVRAAFQRRSDAVDAVVLVPTGSTLLNLGLSDTKEGGYIPGSVVNIVGDSSAGKTFLAWTMFAELARHPHFRNYRLIYDEPEAAFYMKAEKLFGIPEGRVELSTVRSSTIQDWKANVLRALADQQERPFVYVIDSFDALTSVEAQERADALVRTGEEPGSYKTQKAIVASETLAMIAGEIQGTKSLLAVISQTRDNIGVAFGKKKTRSGGNALRFYSTHEIWLSVRSHEKRKEREVGVNVMAKCEKNKLTGKLRQVTFPIFYDYGVDDIGSCIDFLLDEGRWSKSGSKISTNGDFIDGRRDTLIQHIEESFAEDRLQTIVAEKWHEIEASLSTGRKPKYGTSIDGEE